MRRPWIGSAVGEFDYACAEIAAEKPLHEVPGIAYRENGRFASRRTRPTLEDMDSLPFVVDVYKRDLTIENYFIGYLTAPVRLALHGPRLPLEVHVLPVAADARRTSLSRAQRG